MKHQSHPNKIMTLIYVYILGNGQNDRSAVLVLKWNYRLLFHTFLRGLNIYKKNFSSMTTLFFKKLIIKYF